jgi:hypothetical protein
MRWFGVCLVLRSSNAALAFLSPGLVHQFGNLFLTIQGHALVGDRGRAPILQAAERGGRSLRLLRSLLGDPAPIVSEVGTLLEELVELARMGARERKQTLELVGPLPAGRIEASELLPPSVEAIIELLAALPDGATGNLLLSAHADGGTVAVRCDFRAAAGNLPFPLPLPAAALAVMTTGRQFGWRGQCRARPNGLEVLVPLSATAAGTRVSTEA